jgi:MFS transporter, MFS domain-containing protein family, molybdate-anion transporter
MDFYHINLAVFASTNAYLLYRQYQKGKKTAPDFTLVDPTSVEHAEKEELSGTARRFQINYFLPYALAVAADWLQVTRLPFLAQLLLLILYLHVI